MANADYVHKVYPTFYHHPDGRELKIQGEEHLASVLATDPLWEAGAAPYKPPVEKPRPMTAAEVEARLAEFSAMLDSIAKTNDALTKSCADLNELVSELNVRLEEVAETVETKKRR